MSASAANASPQPHAVNGGNGPSYEVTFSRLGTVLAPDGSQRECGGTINPASARLPDGTLMLYPRLVGPANVSSVGRCRSRWTGDDVTFERDGCALEPQVPYELRKTPGGYGCEDPRVTFVAPLDLYLMAYCAYGPDGTKVAIASSADGVTWTRLGIVSFRVATHIYGDKDAAFFPDVVTSPSGVPSIALLHRPTRHQSVAHGRKLAPSMLQLRPKERESIYIAYVPLERARADLQALLEVHETQQVLHPQAHLRAIKVGIGPPPVRIREGWLLVYHAINIMPGHENNAAPAMQYRAAFAILDSERPDCVLYRAPQPFLTPETPEEKHGIVDDVVFPTAIDPRPDLGDRTYDIYYGMADTRIGRGRFVLGDGSV
ncbi:MAG: glycosidase [Candidatus Eremiobacteraeota bacterium]|nr:glycosidase [Candidatus Eremiobacteraeota bacterium]